MLDRKFALRSRNIGLNPFCTVMSHETGHALGNAAIGRKCTVKIQANGFGRCEFSLDGKHDPRDEIFVAALGAASQIAYIQMAIKDRLPWFPKEILQRFWDDYVWTPNLLDWQRLHQHDAAIEFSIEQFQLLTEKLAERIQKDKSLTEVITEVANAPQNLTEEQVEAIASRVSKPLLKLKNYARQQVRRLQKPPKTINKPEGSRVPSKRKRKGQRKVQ